MAKSYFDDLLSQLENNNIVSEKDLVTLINCLCHKDVSDTIKNNGALLQSLHNVFRKLCTSSSILVNKYKEFNEQYSLSTGSL